jgi:hypothetical protein|tara:strand:- start:70 stop:291 length:222 start_codon:yes stop_codon:yes gene_type:complete
MTLPQLVVDAGVAALSKEYGTRAGLYDLWFAREAPRAVALVYEAMNAAMVDEVFEGAQEIGRSIQAGPPRKEK